MLPLGHTAEQFQNLEPEQRDERLLAGVGHVRAPALACGAEHGVVVDPDNAADPDALGALQLGEGAAEIGAGDAHVGAQGSGLRAVGVVQPIAARFRLEDHGTSTSWDLHAVLRFHPVMR